MRSISILLATSACAMLAGCSGGDTGAQSAGSVATSTSTSTTTGTFVSPTSAKTYAGIGAVQHYEYFTDSNRTGQGGQLYAGDAGTVRDSGFSITYDPRDAIFDVTITRAKGSVSTGSLRFQDPAHRTDFGGAKQPQAGVPQLAAAKGIQYLQAGSMTEDKLLSPADPRYDPQSTYVQGDNGFTSTFQTFFYQKPGTTTNYVTYAGFVRNSISAGVQTDGSGNSFLRTNYSIDHAAFVWGEQTANSAVPTTGTADYTGDALATIVYNSRLDTNAAAATYFQWLDGQSKLSVDFGSKSLTATITGTVTAPTQDAHSDHFIEQPAGTAFRAVANGTIDLVNKGGFSGAFTQACFATSCTPANSLNIAGSSLDGAFFGPAAQEIGGSFRIVGGNPDERIDILGAFTGKKP